jgi:hypothetical protein
MPNFYLEGLLVTGIGDMSAYDRGRLVGNAVVTIIGLLLLGKGIITAAKNIPVLLREAVNAATNLRASVRNAKVIVGLVQVLTKSRTPEEVFAAAKAEAQEVLKTARERGKNLVLYGQIADAKMLRQLEELGIPAAESAAARHFALRAAAKKLPPIPGYFDFAIHGSQNSSELWFLVGMDAKGKPIWSHGGDYRGLAKLLQKAGYKGGPVRLIMCYSGQTGIADKLATKLGAEVLAPTGRVIFSPLNKLIFALDEPWAKWVQYFPKRTP